MIEKLTIKNFQDMKLFFEDVKDVYEEMYITKNKERIFLKNNSSLICDVLKHQEIYGILDGRLKAIMIIYKEKGYRPYLRFLAENNKYYKDLLIYLLWNFSDLEVYIKIKKSNPLLNYFVDVINKKYVPKKNFMIKGMRGQEILIIKNKKKILGDKNDHDNRKS